MHKFILGLPSNSSLSYQSIPPVSTPLPPIPVEASEKIAYNSTNRIKKGGPAVKIAIATLGCKVNQYETQALEGELARRGHVLVPFEAQADAYIVNTCSVTAVGDQKSRQLVRRARRLHPEAVVAVCGCYSQTHPEEARALGADLVAGSGDRMGFLSLLEELFQKRSPRFAVDDALSRRAFEVLPPGGLEGRTRAMLKVEDGCTNFCSYCIIPYARGPVRSLPLDAAAEQAAALAAQGFREIVLTGIELSSWGRDLPGRPSLLRLLEAVCAAAPGLRLRLGSLEPRTITPEFAAGLARLPQLCPHFHLSLQSGCDDTLRRMNRKYDSARYYESVELLRDNFPQPGLTTDLIVGFPGETEADFQASLDFVEKCRFSALHVFPYSPRPGTPAAQMPGQLPQEEKKRRVHLASALAERLRRAYLEGLVGQSLPVLFEEEKDGLWHGHAPNYVDVYAPGEGLHNLVRPVLLTALHRDGLLGQATAP